MKKWYFSNNGEITAPLDLDAAKDYLASNPNVYGWHPSFNQWKPVNCISEFVDVLPPTVQAPLIPKEISDQFLAKKQRLEVKLTSIDDSINHSQSSLAKFEQQIASYKDLTKNLNDDVKGAIDNIEKKYKNLSRKLSQVKDAVDIAETEISAVVDDFTHRMSSNDIFMPSCTPSTAILQEQENNVLSDNAQGSKAKLAQEILATPHRRVEPNEAKLEEAQVAIKEPVKNQAKKVTKKVTKKVEKPASQSLLDDTNEASHSPKDSFTGMKNMMKSVFKGDSKIEKEVKTKNIDANKAKEEPRSMAERLKMAQSNQ
ncbi:GYF domain-containing protein [Colwellia sp. TT2012]|uniref:GYF domain-containing protein n=1 Tax=Colwellia sp. TT2012 TaxID=1720342 RepID=UPI00070F0714|nr:GYF domain-containing protein [Colwellia sp. TT2012]